MSMVQAIKVEMDRHPGVTWRIEPGSKHHRVVVEVAGRSRFVPFSLTKTDFRGQRNKISDIRKAIHSLKEG